MFAFAYGILFAFGPSIRAFKLKKIFDLCIVRDE